MTMVRIIGDVHGEAEMLASLLTDRYYHVFIGDLVDRGPDSPGVVRLFLSLHEQGKAEMIVGNHDYKLYRAVKNGTVNDPMVQNTLNQFKDDEVLLSTFIRVIDQSPFWKKIGNHVIVHAAFAPYMALADSPVMNGRPNIVRKNFIIGHAVYGEKEGFLDNGYPNRTYKWIRKVPRHLHVIIGHDYRFDHIHTERNRFGGTVTFLDTGAGKGGKLSFMDIDTTVENHPALPLLTVMVGPSGAGKSTWIRQNADENAIVVSSDDIRQELFGDFRSQENNELVFVIFHERILEALYNGKKVIADATHLKRLERLNTVGLVPENSPVRYVVINRPISDKIATKDWRSVSLIQKHDSIFHNEVENIMEGDGLPNVEVIDLTS